VAGRTGLVSQLVGNRRRVLVSDLSGRGNLLAKARELQIDLDSEQSVLEELKRLEHDGYEFEAAEASFELLVNRLRQGRKPYFDLLGFRVIDEHQGNKMPMSEATVKIRVGDHEEHSVATGNGPVNALDRALHRALLKFYPSLEKVHLVDYKVRVLKSSLSGSASLVRVLISSSDGHSKWGTVGVAANIVEASWHALVDSVEYKLMKDGALPLYSVSDVSNPTHAAL